MTSDSSANRFLQHLQVVYGITSYTVTEKTQVKQGVLYSDLCRCIRGRSSLLADVLTRCMNTNSSWQTLLEC